MLQIRPFDFTRFDDLGESDVPALSGDELCAVLRDLHRRVKSLEEDMGNSLPLQGRVQLDKGALGEMVRKTNRRLEFLETEMCRVAKFLSGEFPSDGESKGFPEVGGFPSDTYREGH